MMMNTLAKACFGIEQNYEMIFNKKFHRRNFVIGIGCHLPSPRSNFRIKYHSAIHKHLQIINILNRKKNIFHVHRVPQAKVNASTLRGDQ